MLKRSYFYLIDVLLFSIIFFIDSFFIMDTLKQQPFVSSWTILFPFCITLLASIGVLAFLGMFLRAVWGYCLAYFILISLSLFLSLFYAYSVVPLNYSIDILIAIIFANALVFSFIVYFQSKKI